MSISGILSTAGRDVFDLAYRISPIILQGGIAQKTEINALPIIALTESISFVNGIISGGNLPNLDNFFAHFSVQPGGTLINNTIGMYPFANQTVAANAIIQNPLNISLVMHCPMRGSGAAVTKLSSLMALQAALELHNTMGGTYAIATPGYLYTNMVMQSFRDVSRNPDTQPQAQFQIDFMRPLTQESQAQQVQSTLMKKLSGGGQTSASWGATGSGNPFSSILGSVLT